MSRLASFLFIPVHVLCWFSCIANAAYAGCEHFIGTIISDQSVGKYSHAQLFNPPDSGKNLEVSRVDIAVTVYNKTPAGTRAADLVVQSAPLQNAGGNLTCKDLGSESQSAGAMFEAALPASLVTGIKPIYEFWFGGAENDHSYEFKPPLIIPPGKGLSIRGGQITMYVVTSWQWSERERTTAAATN